MSGVPRGAGLDPRVREVLEQAGVPFEVLLHDVTYRSAEEGASHLGVGLDQMAPTLVLATEAGPFVATIAGSTRLSLRKVKRALGVRDAALASPADVSRLTGAQPGTVALVNPGLPTLVDQRLLAAPWAYGGGGGPAVTLKMRPADVVLVTGARVLDITEPKAPGADATGQP